MSITTLPPDHLTRPFADRYLAFVANWVVFSSGLTVLISMLTHVFLGLDFTLFGAVAGICAGGIITYVSRHRIER